MDVSSDLKSVTNLNEYISVTQDVASRYSNSSILFNMSTVLSLKKVKSLEIEYFNKCDENGAAIIVFELILRHPPSKTWGLLGIELISLVQYWLEAIRKHLIFHNNHWWHFTRTLISFTERICHKSKSIQDVLVQETAECLLDLATNSRTDLNQSYDIIHCFNMCSAESSRAIRIALRTKLDTYLARVAGAVRTCGDARVQLAGAQALVRWTVPRARRAARAAAAAAWLAPHRFPPPAVDAFVDAAWRNFPQDARQFLEALNEEDSAVVSLRCRSCTAGGAELVTAGGGEHWLDASAGSRSLALHRASDDDAVLLLRDSDIDKISLHSEGAGAVLRVCGRAAARVLLAPEPRALRRLHALLRDAFAHRYATSKDFDSANSDEAEKENNVNSNVDTHASETGAGSGGVRAGGGSRAARAGYVGQRCAPPLSPSTASTSSLLMLRDKLAAFSGVEYCKEPVAVCAAPQLSNVTEATEPDEKLNGTFQPRTRTCGVTARRGRGGGPRDTREDDEVASPIVEQDESNVSCLLVATTGSGEDTAASDHPLPADGHYRTDDIVESLAREALGYRRPTCDRRGPQHTVISTTTTDDSNTDFVENTPLHGTDTNVQRLGSNIMSTGGEKHLNFDNRDVENFFSQHLAENSSRDVVVSPTLARRINRSSSESSVEGDVAPEYIGARELEVDGDVLECLNKIIDIVCDSLQKRVVCLHLDDNPTSERRDVQQAGRHAPSRGRDELNEEKSDPAPKNLKLEVDPKQANSVKRGRRGKKRNVLQPLTATHALDEGLNVAHENVTCKKESISNCNETAPPKTPDTRRKRKLYSPRDDHKIDEETARRDHRGGPPDARNTASTPYKDIENIRNKSLMNTRKKTRPATSTRDQLSPKTKKLNDIFEGLKNTIEGERNITFAARNTRNKGAIYNFPSDSEDEDFVEKKSKVARTTKRGSKLQTTTKSTKGRKPKKVTNENENPRKKASTSGRSRKRPAKNIPKVEQPHVHVERMRATRAEGAELLEISFDADRHRPVEGDPKPAASNPRMEFVVVDDAAAKRSTSEPRKQKDIKPEPDNQSSNILISDRPDNRDATGSPLPGLVIEEVRRDNDVHSASICMLEGLNISADKNFSFLNSTQHLLSDTDQCPRLERDVADAASVATSNESRLAKKRQLSTRKRNSDKTVIKQEHKTGSSKAPDTGRAAIHLDTSSDRSIATFGTSPITAHGDLDEAPPSSRLLERRVTRHRGIEVGGLSGALKDYFDELNEEIEDPPGVRSPPATDRRREAADGRHSLAASVPKLSPVVSIARLSPDVVSRWMPRRLHEDRSSSDGDASRPTSTRCRNVADDAREGHAGADARACNAKQGRLSMISPILLFAGNNRTKSRSSSPKGSSPAARAAREDVFKTPLSRSGSRVSSGRYDLRSSRKARVSSDSLSKKMAESDDFQSKSEVSSTKREYVGHGKSPKRRKVLEEVPNVDSAAASSVGEWMARNVAEDAPGVSESVASADNIDTVLEKLDTTLQEIHYNTSRKLVNMFVEVGRGYAAVRAERERLYRAGVRQVLADVVKLVDAKFTDLERRCSELDASWERGLRERARAVLRDDCRQKRDMLALLRDDLRAARPARTQ